MSNINIQIQEMQEAKRSLRDDGELVSIRYYMRKPDKNIDTWSQTDGVMWQLDNILMLHKIITPLTFSDGTVANTIISKGDWFCLYEGLDFYGTSKKFFKIVDQNQQVYDIDKVVPFVRYGNGYVYWKFIAK